MNKKSNDIASIERTLKDLIFEVKDMRIQVEALKNPPGTKTEKTPTTAVTQPRSKNKRNKWCWSCGYNNNHTSSGCHQKASGHQNEATTDNMMGSSVLGKKNEWNIGNEWMFGNEWIIENEWIIGNEWIIKTEWIIGNE